MAKPQSVVNLDPISVRQRKHKGNIGRFFMTKRFRGKGMAKTEAFGHYLFVGRQRSGKTVSMVWYAQLLKKRYEKRGYTVLFYSNMGIGYKVNRATLSPLLKSLKYVEDKIYIIMLDELQSYFPKDTKDMGLLKLIDELTGEFSQLGKRQIYLLSTAQIYGRVNKNLREQCLFMVNCRRSKLSNRVVNDFIDGDDIMCDDLGRWSGDPRFIYVHGVSDIKFDTHKLITE